MKSILSIVAAVLLLSACSSPKYTYYFDTYQTKPVAKSKVAVKEESPLSIHPETLTASASAEPVMIETMPSAPQATVLDKEALKSELKSMTKQEKKALRKELLNELQNGSSKVTANEGVTTADGVQAMDSDLKWALIFGIVSIGLGIFSWVLGVIAFCVALFFLIRWLSRQ